MYFHIIFSILPMAKFWQNYCSLALVMDESTYQEVSASTATLKKIYVAPPYHLPTMNPPYPGWIFRRVWGMPFSILFSIHQVVDINEFISSSQLPLIFIYQNCTSIKWLERGGIWCNFPPLFSLGKILLSLLGYFVIPIDLWQFIKHCSL